MIEALATPRLIAFAFLAAACGGALPARAVALPDFSQMTYVSGRTTAGVQGDYLPGVGFDGDPTRTRLGTAACEFPLPNLAAGAVFTNVTTGFTVVNSSFSTLTLKPYVGDGTLDASDDLLTPKTSPNRTVNLAGPGQYGVRFADALNPLPIAATSWFGVQATAGGRVDISRGGALGAAPSLTWSAFVPNRGTVTAEPTLEATAIRSGTNAFSIMSQRFDAFSDTVYERGDETRRGLIEYSLGGVPEGATITGASLVINADGFAGTGAPQIFGYSGDGVADASDAWSTLLLGTGKAFAGHADDQTIALDPAALQSLLAAGGSRLGLVLQAAADGTSFGYITSDAPFDNEPPTRLVISYAVPEPASLATLAIAGAIGVRRRRR